MMITALFLILFATSNPAQANNQPVAKQAQQKTAAIKSTAKDLNPEVLQLAVNAYKNAKQQGLVKNPRLTVIDYSLPSNKKRMWIIDMEKNKLDYHLHVAHGKNSGLTTPTQFSNLHNSKASSVGTFITANPYQSKKVGYAMRLDGLDKGYNDNAMMRGVVFHGAKYANPSFLNRHGRLGRSWGCPAVEEKVNRPVINKIKNGSVVYIYAPEQQWLASNTATHNV